MDDVDSVVDSAGGQDKKTNNSDSLSPSHIVSASETVTQNDHSQPIGKIFIEEERGFRAVECKDFYQKKSTVSYSPVNIALRAESCFHTFSNFCHGLLAGIALWQSVATYQLSLPNFSPIDFVNHYGFLAQPMQTLFYFLCIICTVSAFDRFDLGNVKLSMAKQVLFCRTKALVVLIYPLSLLLSLSIGTIDDKFYLYRHNASLWNSTDTQDLQDELFYWKSLNFARCVTSILGWIAIAIEPNENSLVNHLQLQL